METAVLLPESTGGAEAGIVPPADVDTVGATEGVGEAAPVVLAVRADDGEGVALGASEGEAVAPPVELAVRADDGVGVALGASEGEAVAPPVEVGLGASVDVVVKVSSGVREGALDALAEQLRGAAAPAEVQQGHGRHAALLLEPDSGLNVPASHLVQVAFEDAPVAFDHVPWGHAVGATAPAEQ